MRQVTNSLLTSGSRRSDQGAVWSDIDMKMSRLGSKSETSAMAAMYDGLQQPIEVVGAYQAVPGQVGAMFLVNGQPRGMEIFDAPVTWSKLVPKLVRSYALDAISVATEKTPPRKTRWRAARSSTQYRRARPQSSLPSARAVTFV